MTGSLDQRGGTLADFMGFVWRHRVLVAAVTGAMTVVTVVYVLMVPVQYTAQATVLPQEEDTSKMFSAAIAYLGGGVNPLNLGTGMGATVIQESIVRSRKLADAMNEEFNLDQRYKTTKREERLRRWYGRLKTKSNRQGLLTVSYRDRDPEFASQVVTRLLEHLDLYNRESRTNLGRRVREFLQTRVEEAGSRLNALEDSLAEYQTLHKTLIVDAASETASSLASDLLTRRIQLVTDAQMLRRTLGSGAAALRAKEMEIEALNTELSRLPGLNSELSKLLRARKICERTYSFLYAQLEESRIQEARDTRTIDVLDPPIVPQEKSWPQRTWTVLAVFSAAVLVSLLLAKVLDSMKIAQGRLKAEHV